MSAELATQELPPHHMMAYDNLPIHEQGTHPKHSMHKWQVYVKEVDQEARDKRILESPVEYILENRGKYTTLEDKEIRELVHKYQYQGDLDAKEKVVLHNLGLLVHVAKEARRNLNLKPSEMPELLQNGFLGLFRAIEKFDLDHESGAKFSSYAIWWIRQSVWRKHDDTYDTIHIPVHVKNKLRKSQRAYRILHDELGRQPNNTEIAEMIDMDLGALEEMLASTRQPLSLDRYIEKDEDGEWQSRHNQMVEGPEMMFETVAKVETKYNLRELLEHLSYRERRVLELRYGLGGETARTLDEVGRTFNVTRERIRQIENQALKKAQSLAESFKRTGEKLNDSSITSEEVTAREQYARHSRKHLTFADYLAEQSRVYSEERQQRMQIKEHERQLEQERIEFRKHIDNEYEALMRNRAFLSAAHEAGGILSTREEFFAKHQEMPLYIEAETQSDVRLNRYLQQYGRYATATFDLLYKALQAQSSPDHTVTLGALENHIGAYDDTLFDVRPEFLSAVLEAGERQGLIFCDRDKTPIEYRLRTRKDINHDLLQMPTERISGLPDPAAIVWSAIRELGAGRGKDTAITFAQLRRHWSDKTYDINETKLRWSLTYLQRAGVIAIEASKLRGHDIWTKDYQPLKPRIKPQDLWYGDRE